MLQGQRIEKNMDIAYLSPEPTPNPPIDNKIWNIQSTILPKMMKKIKYLRMKDFF